MGVPWPEAAIAPAISNPQASGPGKDIFSFIFRCPGCLVPPKRLPFRCGSATWRAQIVHGYG